MKPGSILVKRSQIKQIKLTHVVQRRKVSTSSFNRGLTAK